MFTTQSLVLSRCSLGLSLIVLLLGSGGCHTQEEIPPESKSIVSGWRIIGPGGGGSTFIPTFDFQDPDTLLLRCDMSGAYLTQDGGNSWALFNFPGGAQSFAFDPSDSSRIIVGATGVHGTEDGGKTWKMLFPDPNSVTQTRHINDHATTFYISTDNFPAGPSSVRSVLVDPSDSNHILAAINSRSEEQGRYEVYCSKDGGQTWNRTATMKEPIIRLISPPDGSVAYVFSRRSSQIFDLKRHEALGVEQEFPEGVSPVDWIEGGVNPDTDGFDLWAIRGSETETGQTSAVLKSTDAGSTWLDVSPSLVASTRRSFNHIATALLDGRTAYLVCDRSIEENPRGESGLWYGIMRTDDGGESWRWVYKAGGGSADYTIRDGWKADNVDDSWVREAFAGEFIAMLNVSVFPGDPDTAVFTDWYRSMKTTDGGETWKALYSETLPDSSIRSRGLDVTTTYGVHLDPFNENHVVISYTDIGYHHSFDGGNTWYRSVNGVPPSWDNTCYWVQFDPAKRDKLWSAWSSWHDIPKLKMIRSPRWKEFAVGGVCVSEDGGRTWRVTSNGLPENAPTTCLALDTQSPEGNRTLYAAVYGKGVYKSVDDGTSWTLKNRGLGENLNAWEVVLANDGTLYLVITHNTQFDGNETLPDLQNGSVYRSRDGAESWQMVHLPERVRFPNSLTVDHENPDLLYLSCWSSMMKGDFGSFSDSRSLLEADGGVFVSSDAGDSWKSTFDTESYVYATSTDPRFPGRVYLVTFHNSAYRSDDHGRSWKKIKGYDFRWGHRPVIDTRDAEKIFITTFGGSVFRGNPQID